MKNDPPEKPTPSESIFRKPSDSDINIDLPNSQFQLDFKLNELGDFEDMIQNKSVKGAFYGKEADGVGGSESGFKRPESNPGFVPKLL